MRPFSGRSLFIGFAMALIVIPVVIGLIVLDSPTAERQQRLDRKRVEDLRRIAAAADLYWTRRGRVPASLAALAREPGPSLALTDPDTARPYRYSVRGRSTYELCAHFEASSGDEVLGENGAFWAHGAETKCFRLDARTVTR
ncbi:MAG: hypothetical protein ACRD2X_17190 [Vicinamibacteraceae bacterium]